tara:strand:+ start:1723 stop:2154 length:432 start_codon:yes stop_codon:yes gene_type:complete
MAEFYEPHKDTLSIFNGVIANKELDRVVSIAIRGNNKQKEIYSIQKSGELMKSETNKEVFIIVNELIFEQLEEVHQVLVAEEAITAIVFDAEKDKLSLKKGDVGITNRGAFSGILKKFTPEMYELVQESIKTLYNVEKEEAEV